MKRTVLFFAAAIGASTLVCQAQGENVKANSTVLNSNAERILQLLEESDPAVALSAEEESAHVERVRRLYELEKEKPVMEEPSGAEADAASPEHRAKT